MYRVLYKVYIQIILVEGIRHLNLRNTEEHGNYCTAMSQVK
jgi:hypothetical protein